MSDDATATHLGPSPAPKVPTSTSTDEGRFLPGTLLADRYRITTLLGRGGMGEVYRATDLRLGQPVALKFLPEALSRDPRALDRFYNEVRIARQVSHANVCRVYDLGEVQGLAYISMEFIDGEDLGSLIRRIGRLPVDKATQIARQLCAGLAAAHDKGVLHRDLKPANIMLDGRGQVRVMDFGLAGLTGQVAGGDIRSGTPAYMAPEQHAGREVSEKSDIYSLGLVLYELFAGRKPFQADTIDDLRKLQESGEPVSLSSQVRDLDPAIERVVRRCLAPDPKDRPSSALAVAAALPGADALAAALAAGETPSPELVAAAGEKAGIGMAFGVACLVVVVLSLFGIAAMFHRVTMLGKLRPENSPDVLVAKARDLCRQLGFPPPVDTASGLEWDGELIRHFRDRKADWDEYAKAQPGPLHLFYRESPRMMSSGHILLDGKIAPYEPPMTASGMVTIKLDQAGRLAWFDAVPPQVDDSPPGGPADWTKLFAAAGADPARFKPAEPKWLPLAGWDHRVAWEGSFASRPDVPIRVEAGSWRGKPTHFYVVAPWTRAGRMEERQRTAGQQTNQLIGLALMGSLLVGVLLFARHNLALGRGDRRGASALALTVFCGSMAASLLEGHYVASSNAGVILPYVVISASLFLAAVAWTCYIALEPAVRRKWPQTLIGWSRLVAGQWRDPVVCAHVLVGLAAGLLTTALALASDLPGPQAGHSPDTGGLAALQGTRFVLSQSILLTVVSPVVNSVINFFLLFLFKLVLRRDWLTAVAFVGLFSLRAALGTNPWFDVPLLLALNSIAVFVMVRFGLLGFAGWALGQSVAERIPLTFDFGAWYGGPSLFAMALVLGLAAFNFRTAVGGRNPRP